MLPVLFQVALGALAAPVVYEEVLPFPVYGEFDPDLYDALLEEAAGRKPDDATAVRLLAEGPDGVVRPLLEFLPEAPPVPVKPEFLPVEPPDSRVHRSLPTDHPGAASGFLSGRAVYISQCHGWIWSEVLNRFATQRGAVWNTVEDFHNPEGANFYLTRYLENAGAAVFTTKERDPNPHLAIVDDGGPGYTELGSSFTNGEAGFAPRTTYPYGTNPFTLGTTRRFPADGGGVARWVPQVPADGHYAVYVSWDAAADHATAAHYRITHPGGTIDRWFNQTVHGSTWQYVETLWLPAGTPLTVELVADGGETGRWLSADAVRIGGGMGDVTRHGVTTGRPRWEEGAISYIQYNGAPASVYDPFWDGDGSDPTSRSRWAAWEHPAGEDAVYLSWHSNAHNGNAYGTITYFAGGGSDAPGTYPRQCTSNAVTGSYSLARAVQDELIASFRALWDPNWHNRNLGTACFAEVSPSNNPEMPAALVELAFHDNEQDALHLKHPRFRQDASRAMYRGIVRYFAERDGLTPVYLPEPPEGLSLVHDDDGQLLLTWEPGPIGAPFGDPPHSYRVFRSADGRSWDNGTDVTGTSWVVPADPGEAVYVKVAAVNNGGISFASEVMGARRSPYGWAPVLVVAAFDRLDRGLLHWVRPHSSLGDIVRMDLYAMNAYDIVVPHGQAITEADWYFDAVSDEVAEIMDLSRYPLVIWATGEESTVDETFSDVQQAALREYLDGGGKLWASGAEILWDLDHAGSESDRAFAVEILGARMEADAAGSHQVDGEGLLEGVGPLDFGMERGGPYPVEWPDVLDSTHPVIARYGDGGIAGVLNDHGALFGFPFDAIADPASRAEVAAALLPALVEDWPPDLPTDTGVDGHTDPPARSSPRVLTRQKGCGCAASGPTPAGALVMLVAMAAWRRRRP